MPFSSQHEAIRLLLLAQSSSGSEKDFRLQNEVLDLFEHSRSGLFSYLRGMGVRDHDAEEVIQEVFLALFQNLRRGQTYKNLRGWTFRVAHNLGLKNQNADRRRASVTDEFIFHRQIDPGPDPEQQASARQRQQKLLAVFDSLPEQDRACLRLRSEGLRYREIAETLGISLGSVAQSLARSLERLHRAEERL